MTQELTLGEWLRNAGKMEIDSVLANPLVSLHTFVETMLPKNPDVRSSVNRLRRLRLQKWADLYERVCTAYGANLRKDRDDLDWLAFAERFSTIAVGVFVRCQAHDTDSNSGVDGELLGQMAVEILPALLDMGPNEIEARQLRKPVVTM